MHIGRTLLLEILLKKSLGCSKAHTMRFVSIALHWSIPRVGYYLTDSIHIGAGKIDMFTPIEARLTHDVGDLSENSVDFGHSGAYDWDKPFKSFHHFARDLGVQEVSWDSRDYYYQRANGSATYEVSVREILGVC